jgi:hypothetical protein
MGVIGWFAQAASGAFIIHSRAVANFMRDEMGNSLPRGRQAKCGVLATNVQNVTPGTGKPALNYASNLRKLIGVEQCYRAYPRLE